MIAKIILMPEEMINQMAKVRKKSGQAGSVIARLAIADYLKKFEEENELNN